MLECSIGNLLDPIPVQNERVQRVGGHKVGEKIGVQRGDVVLVQVEPLKTKEKGELVGGICFENGVY